MSDISKIKLINKSEYNLKDSAATEILHNVQLDTGNLIIADGEVTVYSSQNNFASSMSINEFRFISDYDPTTSAGNIYSSIYGSIVTVGNTYQAGVYVDGALEVKGGLIVDSRNVLADIDAKGSWVILGVTDNTSEGHIYADYSKYRWIVVQLIRSTDVRRPFASQLIPVAHLGSGHAVNVPIVYYDPTSNKYNEVLIKSTSPSDVVIQCVQGTIGWCAAAVYGVI